jgi:hypothetical protein
MKKSFVRMVFAAFICGIGFIGCKDENEHLYPVQNAEITYSKNPEAGKKIGKITDLNLTNLHMNVSAFSEILKGIYKEEFLFSEVNQLISKDYYSDENILLQDFISPENSKLYWVIR